jgi:RimJ/RimL family protein N-acetyltransferase
VGLLGRLRDRLAVLVLLVLRGTPRSPIEELLGLLLVLFLWAGLCAAGLRHAATISPASGHPLADILIRTMPTTPRLLLRQWQDTDLDAWAELNADPEVREFFPELLTRAQAEASMRHFRDELTTRGWGWWAVENTGTGTLIGMAGLDPVDEELPFTGTEIGWRLARDSWGHGYATEAAAAVLTYAFETLNLPEVLAIAAAGNHRSHAVMRRIGMTHVRNFQDPTQPLELADSVLYSIGTSRH